MALDTFSGDGGVKCPRRFAETRPGGLVLPA
jgi:hypothetical protein